MPLRTLCLVLYLSLSAACALSAERAPEAASYELHEWGVFTVPRNEAWAQRDMKQEWSCFPEYFNRSWPTEQLPYRGPVRKPVIYLHAKEKMKVELTVRFAEGRPLVWWPPAQDNLKEPDRLYFNLELVEPQVPAQAVPPKDVPKGHWMEKLRAAKSSMVYTNNGWSRLGTDFVSEHFVYYDGLMKAPPTPKLRRAADAIVLERSNDVLYEDMLIIERNEKGVRCSSWSRWTGGEVKVSEDTLPLKPASDEDLARLRKELVERLAQSGLNADEAEALVVVWHEALFKADGLTLFYRVPQATYDQWLPLQAKPAPSKTIRVGLVLHEHLEPELDARVNALIKQLGAEGFDARDKAQRELTALGGSAFPALEKAAGDDDPEIARACSAILTALDAKPALETKEKSKSQPAPTR